MPRSLQVADVLGVDIVVGTVAMAADAVVERALSGRGGYAVLCNVHVLMTARRHGEVMNAVGGAWKVFPDGAPLVWMQRRAGHRSAMRVGGPDLMPAVLDRGRPGGLRHALFGSTPEVLAGLQGSMCSRFPGVDFVASVSPRPADEQRAEMLDAVHAAKPHVVWVALGAPKQELWMGRFAAELDAVVIGVGAAFDFLAGTKTRAPEWMQRNGLEWAHRLWSEPGRLAGRYVRSNSEFILRAAAEMASKRRAQ
jgi:N-acetylglucosaminyldiphosphoundecaprenol N-acetyl-beta-D-mannosaminyltransferase